jgi:hypothetical protein
MKTDLYTKMILTLIAVCLVWICANGFMPTASAQAQPAPTRVVLVDEKGAPISTAQGLRVNVGTDAFPVTLANQTVPVTISNQTLPVAITAIERRGSWDPIAVDVMKPPPTLMPTP